MRLNSVLTVDLDQAFSLSL